MSAATAFPSLGIVIPTFNQAQYLPTAVRSAFAQDYAGHAEVWVIDDASTDDTPNVLNRLTSEFPTLHVLRQEHNGGIARNATAGLRSPSTEFVIRLDSDDALEPCFAKRLAELMLLHPDAGYGHSAVKEIDERSVIRRIRRLGRKTGFESADSALRAALSGYRAVANIVIFRKSALETVGYYEGRPDFVEDYDLSIRLADAGYGNVYSEEALASYRVWSDSKGMRARRKAMQLEGFQRIFDEAIQPAWERRKWSAREVSRQRARLASRHTPSCFAPDYSKAETEELVALLMRLGRGPRLRVTIMLCRLGFGPALKTLDSLPYRLKSIVKALLVRVRRQWRAVAA